MNISPDFQKTGGLVPAIAQDCETGEVLMLGWMNKDSWQATINGDQAVYWSRSRQKLWKKGETSGHYQIIKEIFLDCDNDTILLKVHQVGVACHTGHKSCFFKTIKADSYSV